jgi:hypothetical protein
MPNPMRLTILVLAVPWPANIRRLMARRTLPLAEEHFLTVHLCGCGFGGIQLAIPPQLRSWGKVQDFLKFAHKMNLAASFENVDTLLCGDDRIPVKISRSDPKSVD